MKISKRISALIAAVLMTVTMFSSTVPAYAATITKRVRLLAVYIK